MTEPEYLDHAESALKAIEMACDRLNDQSDADIDNQRTGGMITLTFANATQIIINLQKPLQEIWLASKAGGFHYKFHSSEWRDTKRNSEFFLDLSEYASAQAGMPLIFTSPV